ncbi:hypothetical protein J7K24_00270 [bacterium]|nr:hypothetical protein [bacterium]
MKIYICNEYRGYNTFDEKIPPVLEELRSGILGKRLFSSSKSLQIYGGWRSSNIPYSYEVFEKNGSLILLEICYDAWNRSRPHDIHLEIINPKPELVEAIREVMYKYPVYSEGESEWDHYVKYKCCPICGCSPEKDRLGFYMGEWKDGQCPNCGWRFKSARTIPLE